MDSAPVGKLVLDGNRLTPLGGGVMSARRRMLFNGVVLASLAVDANGRLRGEPRVTAPGLFDADDPELDRVSGEFADAIEDLAGIAASRRCGVRRCRAGGFASRAWAALAEAAIGGRASAAGMNWFTGVVVYVLIWWTCCSPCCRSARVRSRNPTPDRLARRA